jgi:hypothetical protein
MFHIRLSSEKPEPKPYYYNRMNPQELEVWEIIVSTGCSPTICVLAYSSKGEQKYEWIRDRKGKLRKQRLTPKERAIKQRMFYDTRVGRGVCGDDWMRKDIPKRAP